MHELRRVLEADERLVRVQAEVVFEGGVGLPEHGDVGAGAEELLAVAGQHEHVHVVVEARLEDRRVEVLHHLVRVAVDRRVVEREERDAALGQVVDEGHGPPISGASSPERRAGCARTGAEPCNAQASAVRAPCSRILTRRPPPLRPTPKPAPGAPNPGSPGKNP